MGYFQQVQAALKQTSSPYRWAFVAFITSVLFALCGQLYAQTGGTGAISGAITDPTGAMVVGAQVKVTNVAMGEIRTVQSNDHGLYVVSLLTPGQYTLEVTKQGFKAVKSTDVPVIVAETTAMNIGLETGTVTETVTVASVAEQLQTESSALGRVTDSAMVQNLPLVTRNYTQVIGLNPGVAQALNNAGAIGRGGTSQVLAASGGVTAGSVMSQGASSVDNNFEMNGLPANDNQSSGLYSPGIPTPNPDTIEEFKVQTAQFDATSGRNAGADVDLITKGGTNDYHATLFEFFRNEDLNANDWFAKQQGQARPELRQNQYGFTAGGPLVKNKVLLFGSWQGTKQANALDPSCHHLDLLPALTNDRSYTGLGKVFAGDVSGLGAAAGTVDPTGNGANITPQAYALFNAKLPNGQYVIPNPQTVSTSKGLEVQGTAFLSSPGIFNENQWMANGDYLRNDRDKIAVRYFGAVSNQMQTIFNSTFGFPLFQPERFDVASIADTHTLSTHMVNQLTAGMFRSTSNMYYDYAFHFSTLGINIPASSQDDMVPLIDIANDAFITGTTSALAFLTNEYDIADILSWTTGKHQFTFGGGYRFGRNNMEKFAFNAYDVPLTWADFLLGQAAHTGTNTTPYSNIYETLQITGNTARDWRFKGGDAFIQDDYVITRSLTLNLGLRYEHIGDFGVANHIGGNVILSDLNPNPPATGSVAGYEVASNYNGPALPAGVVQGNNTFGINGQGQETWNPRVGFAWMLPGSQRFLLRGGVGTYHSQLVSQMNLQLCGEQPTGQRMYTIGTYNGAATDANPFPDPGTFPQFIPYSPTTYSTMFGFDQGYRPPTTYHYSLGLQTKLPGDAILDVSYAGARDLHLIVGVSANNAPLASPSNPIRGQTTNTLANIGQRAPYIGWSTVAMYQWRTGNEAWYSALEASLTQQWKHNLQYQASFTWARLLSPVPAFSLGTNFAQPIGDQNNLRAGYGPDENIRPLRFVLSALYNLPGPTNNHLLADIIGGWSVATATTIQDGQQTSILYTNAANYAGENGPSTDRASYAAGCTAANLQTSGSVGHRVGGYINKACLAAPAFIVDSGGTENVRGFGNTSSGVLRAPDQIDVDLSLDKTVQVNWPKEGANVQFKTDFFNTLNHPSFANPNPLYPSAAFGTITAMSTNPRLIQFALKYSF